MNLLTPTGWKDINDVNVGDELVAFDVNTGEEILNQLLSKQLLTVPEEEAAFYRINGTWTLYKNQSVWVDGRVDHAFNLKPGDTVYNGTDYDVSVTTVEEVAGTEWWRLEVSGDHSYIADDLTLHNASRYWVGGGSSANWNATANTNWGSVSGGANNASIPTSVDDVTFDGAGATGNTNSTISAGISISAFIITGGYTATMTHNATLTVLGNWTMSNTHTIAGTSSIIKGGSTTITSNGQSWPNSITVGHDPNYGNVVITLVGSFICLGTTSFNVGILYDAYINKTTTETWSTNGLTTPSSRSMLGTAEVILTGGTWSGSGYASTDLTIAGNITISGTVLMGAKTIKYLSGTISHINNSTLQVVGSTLNTAGASFNNVTLGIANYGFMTITLLSNFSCTGSTTVSNGIYSVTLNGTGYTYSTIGLTISNQLSGTAEIILAGGTWSSTAYMSNKLTLDSGANTITISGTVLYLSNTIKYSSGTISHINNSTLNIQGPVNLDTNGMSWNNVNLDVSNGNNTITLISNFLCGGTTTFGTGIYTNTVNSTTNQTWTTNGLTSNREISFGSTIAEIILTGGTWSGAASVNKNLTIAGNVSVTSNVYFYNGTLKRTAGSITGGGTINLTASCTLDTQGSEWSVNTTLSNTNSQIYTINSLYVITGTLTFGTAGLTTFAGTSGWTCGTLLNANTQTVTVSLKDGNTYTVTGALTAFQSRSGSQVLFTSSHASNRAILTLRNPSTCNCLASFTRIDASAGRTITTFNGTVTDCLNVLSYNDMRPVAA